eukprot:8601009-Lingulodinium_polyedra.AAC.1
MPLNPTKNSVCTAKHSGGPEPPCHPHGLEPSTHDLDARLLPYGAIADVLGQAADCVEATA